MKSRIKFNLIATSSTNPQVVETTKGFNERIRLLVEEKCYCSGGLFCEIIGVQFQEGQELTIDLLSKIINSYPHLSLKWLITGIGELEHKKIDLRVAELKMKIEVQGAMIDKMLHRSDREVEKAFKALDDAHKIVNDTKLLLEEKDKLIAQLKEELNAYKNKEKEKEEK